MSLRINHNIASINGHRNMMRNDMAISKSLEKLSSGLRINRAADDAAGLVISEQMRAQITGLNQAIDNSETAISMVQTAEGALDEVNSLLNKARELVIHAANEGANDANQLAADQAELDNVIASISRISDVTQFGTKKLLDGSLAGSESLSSGLNRVSVGNLANNSAVSAGTISVAVTGAGYESISVEGGSVVDSGDYIFTGGTISAMEDVATGASINSGASLKVTIDGTAYTAQNDDAGAQTVTSLVAEINAALSGAGAGFELSQKAGGGLEVGRTTIDETDFTATIEFQRLCGEDAGTAGTTAKTTAVLSVGSGATEDDVTNALFGTADLSGVTTASTFNGSGSINFALTTASGATHITGFAYSGGATVESVFNDIISGLTGVAGLSAVTMSLSAGATGLSITLDSNNEALGKVDFSLAIDNDNSLTQVFEAAGLTINDVGGGTGGETTLFGDGLSGVGTGTTMVTGAVFTITVNGRTYAETASAGEALGDVITNLQTAINADADLSGTFELRFFSAAALISGTNADATGITGLDAQVGAAESQLFLVRTDNSGPATIDFTLTIDSAAVTGTDFYATGADSQNGVAADASFNMETVALSGAVSGVATDNGTATVTLTSTSGTTTSGSDSVTATLTSSTGLSLALSSSGSNLAVSASEGATLVLSDAVGNAGFSDIQLEIDGTTATSSSATVSFTLNAGAQFHVGANADQKVGLTIRDLDAVELGRNVADAGTLRSLNDLLGTEQSALTSGLTDEALRVIDAAIDEVTVLRGDLGAFQANTLETGLNSLMISQENLTAAESTIRDVDFAAESAQFTRNNIMIQASTAMLAQANQLPQNVLQLLG